MPRPSAFSPPRAHGQNISLSPELLKISAVPADFKALGDRADQILKRLWLGPQLTARWIALERGFSRGQRGVEKESHENKFLIYDRRWKRRHEALQMLDAAQIAFVPAVADCVEEHFPVIELHRDDKPHVTKADGERGALIGVGFVNGLNLNDKPKDVRNRFRTAFRFKLIKTNIARPVASFRRVHNELADQSILRPEVIVERGSVSGACLRHDVAYGDAIDPTNGEEVHRCRFQSVPRSILVNRISSWQSLCAGSPFYDGVFRWSHL
jgi:hypothetical protein